MKQKASELAEENSERLGFKGGKTWYINFSVINNKLPPGSNIPEEKYMPLVDIPKRHGALVWPRVIPGVIFPPHSLPLRSCPLL